MTACPEFAPLLELRLTDSLGEQAPRLEEHLATCAACRAEATAHDDLLGLARLAPLTADERRSLEGLSFSTWKEMERARVRRLVGRGGFGLAAAAAAIALFVWPHPAARVTPGAVPATVASASAASGGDVLDLGFAGDDDDDTLDLEDFAALDTASTAGSMGSSAGDDDDDDTLLQGEEL